MELTLCGLRDAAEWKRAGVEVPAYDPAGAAEAALEKPVWVHFGIGNIFRVFMNGIADALIRAGKLEAGIIGAETWDTELVDRIYVPHDCLTLAVTLHGDGTTDRRVLGSVAEARKARPEFRADWARLKQVFAAPSLQMVSFTITEKGYAPAGSDGRLPEQLRADMQAGPERVSGAMGVVTALLHERFRAGGAPLALVSMDNVSRNGERLRTTVLKVAEAWAERGLAEEGFVSWLRDEGRVSFPWTMIDKITPRPDPGIAAELEELGIRDMQPVVTEKDTFIAPFVNAEGPQYLVIEDAFPNGRPPLEAAGVYLADRETVNRSERMKVTACLNPIHTALAPYDILLGYEYFADGMRDPELKRLAHQVGYLEGLPVVEDPGILSPRAFLDEVIQERFPNVFLKDTSQRICTDISQGVPFRFGETIRAWAAREGTAAGLKGIPLAIAGWLRYLLETDDRGRACALAPDPMIPELKERLSGIRVGAPDSCGDRLRPILSNAGLFGVNLYEAGLGEKIEALFREEIAGEGAVRETLKRHLDAGTSLFA